MTPVLLVTIKLSVLALILSIGMGAVFRDVLHLSQRPGLLVRSVLAMYVVVPLAAYVLVAILPLMPAVKAAMLVLAVSAGAPLLPRKLNALGTSPYAFSLVVMSSLLAIVIVPAWVALLARHFDVATRVPPLEAARAIATTLLVPLLVGMVARWLAPAWSERLSSRLAPIAGIALAAAGLTLLALHWNFLMQVGIDGIAALLLLLVVAVLSGHLLGGPLEQDRAALAVACGTRHIAIAAIVAGTFPGPRTLVLLATYLVASAAVTIPYLRWQRSRLSVTEKAQ